MKTLDDLGARMMSADDVRALFPGEWWHDFFDQMNDVPPVHFIEGSLSVDDLDAGDGPWALIVHGDVHATGNLDFGTSDYKVSALVVFGSVHARNFRFTNGANCYVVHDLIARDFVFGRYGDESARLAVGGLLKARAVLLDHVTGVDAAELDAIVCATEGWQLPLDIDYYADVSDLFVSDVIDVDGRIDLFRAWTVAARGEAVFAPGAEERLRPVGPRKLQR
jgi:hypothetical protein